MGEVSADTGRRQALCQTAILCVALVVRWPCPEPRWELGGGDEWAFIVHCLGFFSGDLNPHFFKYPTLHFYLTSILYYLYYLVFSGEPLEHFIAYRYFVEDWDLLAIARGFNTLLAVATVAVTMAIARRLYGPVGGLLAGIVLALMPLHVRFSHVAITDVPAAFWSALALWGAVCICQRGSRQDHILAGVCVGLAGASKYPAALVVVPVLVAVWSGVSPGRWAGSRRVVIAALATFCVATPYVYLDPGGFWTDFSDMGRTHLLGQGAADNNIAANIPFTWDYPLFYNLRYGLGWVGLLTAGAACLWRPRGWRIDERVLIAALAVFTAILLIAESTFLRYALPLAPILAVLLVRPLLGLALSKIVRVIWVVALLAEPISASLNMRALLSRADTRVMAREWMQQHLDRGRLLLSLPISDGMINLLEPGGVYTRQARFVNSFGEQRLAQAYAYLRRLDGLPHLYMGWDQEQIEPYIAVQDGAIDSVLVLWYRHPLRAMDEDAQVLQQVHWQSKFAAGALDQAVFDRSGPPPGSDFLPVGGWQGIERNGPDLWLGWLPIKERLQTLPTTQMFFGLLHDFFVASRAVAQRDMQQALLSYKAVENASVPLLWVLPQSYVYRLYWDLGNIHYHHLGDRVQALQYWQQAAAINPAAEGLYYSMGVASEELQRFAAASDYYRLASERKPQDAELYYRLGICRLRLGAYEAGIEAMERARVLAPTDVETLVNLGMAYGLLGQIDRQQSYFTEALSLAPEHPQAEMMRQVLAPGPP